MNSVFREVSPKQWKNDIYTIKELMKIHYLRLALACVSGLFLSSINGAIAWFVKPVLDGLFVEKNNALLMVLPIGVFFLFVLRGLFALSNNYLMFSTVQKADRIIVMDKGAIIQQGNHSDLSSQVGVYQELYSKSTVTAPSDLRF
jgi:ABC-type multidrug transport system fused ATPase/permease subunit